MANIKVSKLDAAKRQLGAAIKLWFDDEDPVAIHLLAYSAHEIVHRLYRSKGLSNLLFDAKSINEEYRDEYNISLKRAANFFKHAKQGKDDDPSATIEFNPELNELFLYMSVIGLGAMGERPTYDYFAFFGYVTIQNHQWIPEELFKRHFPVDALKSLQTLKGLPKKDFLENWKSGIERMGNAAPQFA